MTVTLGQLHSCSMTQCAYLKMGMIRGPTSRAVTLQKEVKAGKASPIPWQVPVGVSRRVRTVGKGLLGGGGLFPGTEPAAEKVFGTWLVIRWKRGRGFISHRDGCCQVWAQNTSQQ